MFKFVLFICIGTVYCLSPQISTKLESFNAQGDHSEKKLSVICTNNACNKTESNKVNNKLGAIVKNDVVVKINTNIDIAENSSSNIADDTPDVPVVLGLAGVEKDGNWRRDDDISLVKQVPDSLVFHQLPSTSTVAPDFGFDYSISEKNPTVYIQPPKTQYLHPEITNFGQRNLLDGIVYRTMNEINLHKLPYFEPTYNKHYFGERPPPQFVWTAKTTVGAHNPVAFVNTQKSLWQPLQNHYPRTYTTNRPCDFHEQTNWYPGLSSTTPFPNHRNLKVKIDDKLAPLN